jgi:phenylacetate-CoA ligase
MGIYGSVYKRVLFPFYEQVLRGRNTLRLLKTMEQDQWLPAQTLRERQWERVRHVLRYCEEHVPYYGRAFAEAGVRAEQVRSPEDMARLPMLSKDDLRHHHDELIAPERRAGLYALTTSGSSGVPVRVALDHEAYERRLAAWMRGDRWAGWDLGLRTFQLVGARPMGKTTAWHEAKKRIHRALSCQMIVTALSMSPAILMDYYRAMQSYRPQVVIGYASSLHFFARFLRENGLTPHRPRGIIVCAERIFGPQKDYIAEVFAAPVFERYGCMEFSFIAGECSGHCGLHVNSDNLFVEILDEDGRPSPPGQSGEVVVTGLNNLAMPLVRYRLGDMAAWAGAPCTCGRGLPLLSGLAGRTMDMITTSGGRICSGIVFPYIVDEFPSVAQYQVVQVSPDEILIRIIPDEGFGADVRAQIEAGLRPYLGPEVRLRFETTDHIPPSPAGKFEHVKSLINGTSSVPPRG